MINNRYLYTIVLILGLLYIFTIYFSFNRGNMISEKYSPLVDAAMDIKLEATKSHLYLEELLYGEATKTIDEILDYIAEAKWYANAMLNGGINHEGTFLPLHNLAMREKVKNILIGLDKFEKLTLVRYKQKDSSNNTKLHHKYNIEFQHFIKDCDAVEAQIQIFMKSELYRFNLLKIFLIFLSIVTLTATVIIVRLYEKRRKVSENKQLEFIATIEKQNTLLTELSHTDSLTNVANRRHFDSFSIEKFTWAKRKQEIISFIMVDIDYFKLYNDFYGHAEGDKCLQTVALQMKHTLRRPTDLLARYGGEEFAIVLLDTDNADEFAETIRKDVEDLKLVHEKSQCSEFITVSIGVASGIPNDDMEPFSLLLRADKALYQAKASGRNCIKVG